MATTVAGSGTMSGRPAPARPRRPLGVLGILGLILAGLGSFLLVSGVGLRFFVAGDVVKFPLNEYQVATLGARDVTYFSSAQAKPLTGVTMRVTTTIEGDSAAGSDHRAVWNRFSSYIDVTNGVPYDAITQRSAFDRRSGEAISCCGATVASAAGTYTGPQSGQAYTWPIGAGHSTYQVFDTVLHRPVPAAFSGTDVIAGIPVNKYTEQVRGAKVGTQKLPGQLVGLKGQATVVLDEFYQDTSTFWVDPVTGTVLEQEQNEKLTLRSGGAQRLVLLQGDFQTTPASVAALAAKDRPHRSAIVSITTTVPLLLGISGAVILAAGILLSVGRRRRPSRATPRYETVGMAS